MDTEKQPHDETIVAEKPEEEKPAQTIADTVSDLEASSATLIAHSAEAVVDRFKQEATVGSPPPKPAKAKPAPPSPPAPKAKKTKKKTAKTTPKKSRGKTMAKKAKKKTAKAAVKTSAKKMMPKKKKSRG